MTKTQETTSKSKPTTWAVTYSTYSGRETKGGFVSRAAAKRWADLALSGSMRVLRYFDESELDLSL